MWPFASESKRELRTTIAALRETLDLERKVNQTLRATIRSADGKIQSLSAQLTAMRSPAVVRHLPNQKPRRYSAVPGHHEHCDVNDPFIRTKPCNCATAIPVLEDVPTAPLGQLDPVCHNDNTGDAA